MGMQRRPDHHIVQPWIELRPLSLSLLARAAGGAGGRAGSALLMDLIGICHGHACSLRLSSVYVLAGQQGVLVDVLEAPQLMDTCVRNGNYDDALDLRAFVAKLLLIHPHLQVRQLRVCALDS